MPKVALNPQAKALLDAQVAFYMRDLKGARLERLIRNALDSLLNIAETLQLENVVTVEQIWETAHFYAVHLDMKAAVPEITAATAQTLLEYLRLQTTTLEELFPLHYVRDLLLKSIEMHQLRQNHLGLIRENAAVASTFAEFILQRFAEWSRERLPKIVHPVLQRLFQTPALQDPLHEMLMNLVQLGLNEAIDQLNHMDQANMLELCLDLWERVRMQPVASLIQPFRALDLEDYFVIIFEYWKDLRQTRLYQDVIRTGVETFFEVYGNCTLAELLDELGITKEMMLNDALRFGPHIMNILHKHNMVEPIVRHHLERFYHSEAAIKIFSAAQPSL